MYILIHNNFSYLEYVSLLNFGDHQIYYYVETNNYMENASVCSHWMQLLLKL
jgi:hypothetical protein